MFGRCCFQVGRVTKNSIVTERESHCCFHVGPINVDMLRRLVSETQPGKSEKEGVEVLALQMSRKSPKLGELLGYHIKTECGCKCMIQRYVGEERLRDVLGCNPMLG